MKEMTKEVKKKFFWLVIAIVIGIFTVHGLIDITKKILPAPNRLAEQSNYLGIDFITEETHVVVTDSLVVIFYPINRAPNFLIVYFKHKDSLCVDKYEVVVCANSRAAKTLIKMHSLDDVKQNKLKGKMIIVGDLQQRIDDDYRELRKKFGKILEK